MARQARVFASSFLVETLALYHDEVVVEDQAEVSAAEEVESLNHFVYKAPRVRYPELGNDDRFEITFGEYGTWDWDESTTPAPVPETVVIEPPADEHEVMESFNPMRLSQERAERTGRHEGKHQIVLTRSIRKLRKTQRMTNEERRDER